MRDPIANKARSAHRVAYELFIGPIPDGLSVLHSCDNGHMGCVNPVHLRAATNKENSEEMVRKGRGRGRYSKTPPRAIALFRTRPQRAKLKYD